MHPSYDDIIARIDTEPLWFDEHAVPRYCAFEPNRSANIFTSEIALIEISCQECAQRFRVAFSGMNFGHMNIMTLAEGIKEKLIFIEPPRHNLKTCAAGSATSCEPIRVLEYWRRPPRGDHTSWTRDPSLEIDLRS
jgi:hypothetical protein